MRAGILGGTFDPIHVGHLLMAESVREALDLQQVLFVPAGDPPHKQDRQLTPAGHRQAMVELALAHHPHFQLCSIDLDRPGPHYSTDTVSLIRERAMLSAEQCYFIIGSDSLLDLPTWHRPAELIKLCRLAVVKRPGVHIDLAALERKLPGIVDRLSWVEMPVIGVSASNIRARVKAGRSIRYQVVEEVRAYVGEHGLYK